MFSNFLKSAYWLLMLNCRSSGGAELDSQSHGAFIPHRAAGDVCDNYLRYSRPGIVLRHAA